MITYIEEMLSFYKPALVNVNTSDLNETDKCAL